jgi:hypothetical protein
MDIQTVAKRYPDLMEQLERYVVGRYSGILHINAVTQYGFEAPERDADAIWRTEPAQEDNPYEMQAQCEWWQEDGFILGIKQVADPVMGMDHFTWYRILEADMLQLEQPGMEKVYDSDLTNDLIIRHANARNKHERKAYHNLLCYLDLLEAGRMTAKYLIKTLHHEIKCANWHIHIKRRFDPKYSRGERAIVEIYTWAIPVFEQAFCSAVTEQT